MIPAKEFEGKLWIKASDHHQAIKDAKREWQGLTDEERFELWDNTVKYAPGEVRIKDFSRAIEAKLKEKNHG
jgi:hypothetical protein